MSRCFELTSTSFYNTTSTLYIYLKLFKSLWLYKRIFNFTSVSTSQVHFDFTREFSVLQVFQLHKFTLTLQENFQFYKCFNFTSSLWLYKRIFSFTSVSSSQVHFDFTIEFSILQVFQLHKFTLTLQENFQFYKCFNFTSSLWLYKRIFSFTSVPSSLVHFDIRRHFSILQVFQLHRFQLYKYV